MCLQSSITGGLLSTILARKPEGYVLADGFFYARGVVLAPAQRFVLVVETM